MLANKPFKQPPMFQLPNERDVLIGCIEKAKNEFDLISSIENELYPELSASIKKLLSIEMIYYADRLNKLFIQYESEQHSETGATSL